MIRTEESKRLWKLAEASQDWEAMEKIEAEWETLEIQDETYYDNRIDWDSATTDSWSDEGDYDDTFCDIRDNRELPWTDEDEAGLEEYEERKRQRIAEANEY